MKPHGAATIVWSPLFLCGHKKRSVVGPDPSTCEMTNMPAPAPTLMPSMEPTVLICICTPSRYVVELVQTQPCSDANVPLSRPGIANITCFPDASEITSTIRRIVTHELGEFNGICLSSSKRNIYTSGRPSQYEFCLQSFFSTCPNGSSTGMEVGGAQPNGTRFTHSPRGAVDTPSNQLLMEISQSFTPLVPTYDVEFTSVCGTPPPLQVGDVLGVFRVVSASIGSWRDVRRDTVVSFTHSLTMFATGGE